MRSNPPCCSVAQNAASVSTRITSQAIPSVVSVQCASSASVTSSSRCRIRNGEPIACLALPDASGRRLVDDRPKNSEFLNGVYELVEIHGLHHVGVDAQLVARHHVLFFTGGGEHHHGDQLQVVIRLHLL